MDEASGSLVPTIIKKFKEDFYKSSQNVLALNACTKIDPNIISTSRKCLETTQHVFDVTVEGAGKPITNQKSCGSCWMYACLNTARIPFIRSLDLDNFEFSQAHLFFWHKVEYSNFWLNNIVKTAKAKEPIDGRIVDYLLQNPVTDAGQWDMMVNLIKKYGMVPKECFPNSFSLEASNKVNDILTSLLRLYAKELREMVEKKATDAEISAKIEKQMYEVFKVLAICFSIPPEKFTWQYKNKSGTHTIGPVTPLEFYEKYVKPAFNFDDKVCLVNDPRPSNPYMKAYTVEFLGNMVEGRPIIYNNQPVELLLKLSAESIKNNEPVWFGCEVGKSWSSKDGIGDLNLIDYNTTFGLTQQLIPKKADRMIYCDSMMSHAVVMIAVSFNEKHEPIKFQIENSWGEDSGKKGYLLITVPWFKEFVFEIVVDKKFVSKEVLDVFNQTPKVLPPWDPMGTLAQ